MGVPLGNLEGGSFTRDFERWMKEGSGKGACLRGSSMREPGGRAPLLGNLKGIVSKSLERDACFHRGPDFGEHGGTLLSWSLWEKGKISFIRGIFLRKLRDTYKKALQTGNSLHRGLCEREGGRLLGLSRNRWRTLETENLLLFYVVLRRKPQFTFCVCVWGFGFTQSCISGFLLFGPWGYYEFKYRDQLEP